MRKVEPYRSFDGANRALGELDNRIKHLTVAVDSTPAATEDQASQVRELRSRLQQLQVSFRGDRTVASRQEHVPWSISQRVGSLYGGLLESQADIPGNYRTSMQIAQQQLATAMQSLHQLDADLSQFEATME